MAKPMKTIELHYPMIQFLIIYYYYLLENYYLSPTVLTILSLLVFFFTPLKQRFNTIYADKIDFDILKPITEISGKLEIKTQNDYLT